MLLHFHVGRIPFTLNIGKRPEDRERSGEGSRACLVRSATSPMRGSSARYVLRRWAGGGR